MSETILDTDIKLMASERLADTEDGGGMMSAVEIVDGVVNNAFPDISRLDRTYGRVNLRKLYAAVQTANKAMYYGSHVIITDAPDDPRVSVLMFTTGSYIDERTNARDRIESYVVTGPESLYVLLGDQLEGQRMVRVYSRLDVKLPEVGQVYLLSEEDSNGNVQGEQQYVRIDSVEHEEQEFEDSRGVFIRRVYTLEIGNPLRRTFPGPETAIRYSEHESPTLFRSTQVADASKYYGIVKLEEAITPGDMTLKAETIFGQLVPSATVESPVVDVQAGVERANLVAAGEEYSVANNIEHSVPGSGVSFGRAVVPGSVAVAYADTYTGTSNWSATDDSNGNVVDSGGVTRGTIDYETGVFAGVTTYVYGIKSWVITATPAAAIQDTAHTASEEIDFENRGYNYVKTLRPTPQPTTLFVDYMSQGEWYRMQDNGLGELEDEYGGTGIIDYATGSVIATLGALPDVGSQVIYTWATPVHYEQRLTDPDSETAYLTFTVNQGEIIPNSLTLEWDVNGTTKTATDDGNGNLTGDATGRVVYGMGEVGWKPASLPDSDANLTVHYDIGFNQQETPSYTVNGDDIQLSVANAPIRPGTFAATFTQGYSKQEVKGVRFDTKTGTRDLRVLDNGDGTLSVEGTGEAGTINYTTGAVVIRTNWSKSNTEYAYVSGAWAPVTVTDQYWVTGAVTINYQEDSVTATNQTETLAIPNATANLVPSTNRQVVPGSVEFTWNGKTVIDREGTLYTDWDRQTGAAIACGTINYATGDVVFDDYQGGGTNSITIKTLLVKIGAWSCSELYFRTPGSPLRPSSFYLRATKPDGSLVGATANAQGLLDTNDIQGSIDYDTGVVDVQFGAWVNDADLTADDKAEPWYDAADVQGDGTIWRPDPVDPGTMKFNAVVYSMMPLNADILGLDPVRLPIDGRVPIIRNGDVVVIHSTKTETLSSPLSPGEVETLAYDQLASCTLIDAEGTAVDSALYSVNRETGVVTMADPLDLSAYVEPLHARYRIEDMALVNEAQINGQLSLVGAIGRNYDPADTWVSSALIFGDLGARVHHVFDQSSWTGTWSDERIGGEPLAEYNDLLYPIQVNNKNAIRERWAIIFTSSTTFNVVGETSGQIASGNTTTDCAPINPITGEPYFTILWQGWGSGWSSNNVLRFNTDAAHAPVWIARTTVSGTPTKQDDSFKLQIRGDAD
ncbi:hypothetical protein [Marinobacterium litorale]|uniref:hypothetical protein n=1 Tax=Marinobacterium litorale TaxID=404770 RepID=UPI00040A8708|nr:hypothetical protein [Marinobacterium litorale]